MTKHRHARKVMKPYLRWTGVRGFPEELLRLPAALEECRRLAVEQCSAEAASQGYRVVGSPETAVVKAVNGDRFTGGYQHGVQVAIRCQR